MTERELDELLTFACLANDDDWRPHAARLDAMPAATLEALLVQLFTGKLAQFGAARKATETAIERLTDVAAHLMLLPPSCATLRDLPPNARPGTLGLDLARGQRLRAASARLFSDWFVDGGHYDDDVTPSRLDGWLRSLTAGLLTHPARRELFRPFLVALLEAAGNRPWLYEPITMCMLEMQLAVDEDADD